MLQGKAYQSYLEAPEYDSNTGRLILRPEIRLDWRRSLHGEAYLNDFLQNQVELFNTQPPVPEGSRPTVEDLEKMYFENKGRGRSWGERLRYRFRKNEQKVDPDSLEAWGDPSCIL